MQLSKLISGFSFGRAGKSRQAKIGKTDLGVLKVAFMIAALDGEVTDAEYKVFDLLAKKCRGYSPKAAEAALKEAMRSAGYLMLLSHRVSERELVKAFILEAQQALPLGFAYLSGDEVRQAFITWVMMGMGDGDYSPREKSCIDALRKQFAELKVMRDMQNSEPWIVLTPVYGDAFAAPRSSSRVELVSDDFVRMVEGTIAQYGDNAAAAKELKKLIEGGGQ